MFLQGFEGNENWFNYQGIMQTFIVTDNKGQTCCFLCNKNLNKDVDESAQSQVLNFQRFELWRVTFPTGFKSWFEFARFSSNRGFEKSGVKLQC